MTSLQAGLPIDHPNIKLIDNSKLKSFAIHEGPQDLYQRFVDSTEKFLEIRHSQMPDTSSHPAYRDYATVRVDGKVVAEIDNNGFVKTSSALGAELADGLPGQVNGRTGPVLAQARAEYIAGLLGGKVEKSASALTQHQFEALPKPRISVDHAAVEADPLYHDLQKIKQARTLFLAQQIGQSATTA